MIGTIGYKSGDAIPVQDAMRVVASWVSRNSKVKVIYGNGNTPSADIHKGIIRIPRIGHVEFETLMKLRTFILHEAGHIAETKLTKKQTPKGALHTIFNALEDIRMERVLAGEYKGAKVVFEWADTYFNRDCAKKYSKPDANAPLHEALVAMMFRVRGKIPAWHLSGKAQAYVDAAYGEFVKVQTTHNAKNCVVLAERIYKLLKEAKKEYEKEQEQEQQEQEQEQQEQGQESGESQPQAASDIEDDEDSESGSGSDEEDETDEEDEEEEGDESSSGSDEEDEEDEEDSESGSGSDEDDDEDDEENDSGIDGESDKSDADSDDSDSDVSDTESSIPEKTDSEHDKELDEEADARDKMDVLIDAIKEELDDMGNSYDREYTSLRDFDRVDLIESNDYLLQSFVELRAKLSASIMNLSRALEQALRTMAMSRKNPYQEFGKIDPRRLVDIAKSLTKKVCYTTMLGRELDTAVVITMDESGSMSMFNKCGTMRELAIALGECLTNIGVPFEIVGSTTLGLAAISDWFSRRDEFTQFSRFNPIRYKVYKQFHENWLDNRVRSRVMQISHHKNNIDGEVLEFAETRLSARSESRKIIFSLSDGIPESGQGNDEEMGENLIRVCDRIRKSGVEVFGFGMLTSAPARYYGEKWFIPIASVEKIGTDFLKNFTKIITKGMFQA